jgi:hypothetical protein|tara:strand:+ start:314 stop:538 length:225 start_codon:yes stop_codon:yes gene_type:complete
MDIRKVSIGSDYKASMHYIVGQPVLGNSHRIHLILSDIDTNSVKIWIENEKQEVVLWKKFNHTIPMSIEYNINF